MIRRAWKSGDDRPRQQHHEEGAQRGADPDPAILDAVLPGLLQAPHLGERQRIGERRHAALRYDDEDGTQKHQQNARCEAKAEVAKRHCAGTKGKRRGNAAPVGDKGDDRH